MNSKNITHNIIGMMKSPVFYLAIMTLWMSYSFWRWYYDFFPTSESDVRVGESIISLLINSSDQQKRFSAAFTLVPTIVLLWAWFRLFEFEMERIEKQKDKNACQEGERIFVIALIYVACYFCFGGFGLFHNLNSFLC